MSKDNTELKRYDIKSGSRGGWITDSIEHEEHGGYFRCEDVEALKNRLQDATDTLEKIKKHQGVVMGMRTEGLKLSATYQMADEALKRLDK